MRAVSPAAILKGDTQLYIDVFGNLDGIELATSVDDVTYAIFDRYCMNPNCKCNDVFLRFLTNKKDFAITLSLKTKKYEIVDKTGISEEQAIKVVKHSLKDSDKAIQLFKERYAKMKNAGREALKGIVQMDEPTRQKPDRNAPCPCGSGKKYKKCCGL
ncbi:SEC-C motif-containing protein [Scopulibacillus darangshiensis]|uniref:SEC-C motif-containing protein n=1 Tax=Scopulibacillus darangshiensis TaxID=442528 RepID=A0A4R2NFA5_9BACL|nr:SEC-C metal-binding domain-containing protein [Scopulibacillus darangshiensis]TCP19930.1 SEC-C motif-containing protein [Scopulibacillus darangshiensis]